MTEERDPKPAEESTAAITAARQRKKRKWDQPAESFISSGLSVAGTLPFGMVNTIGIPLPGAILLPSSVTANSVPANSAAASLLFQSASISQNPAAVIQKLTQPKIQDELIAREIVINDAEPTTRYKLTKRQTQEEIQRATGAVVITRGKYRPPNVLLDSEKPLYLHISAGAHLKETADRIKAVDHAAAMIEDILKQGQNSPPATGPLLSTVSNEQAIQPLSIYMYLGFETDPSLNIAARIRGPNDMYINHIMNETGATVVLRGKGSGILENSNMEETQQPLHLYLSSTDPKNLEAARSLAENLLDTISAECGASRSSCKAYSAVPPPQQLLSGVCSSGEACGVSSSRLAVGPMPSTTVLLTNGSTGAHVSVPGSVSHSAAVLTYSGTQPLTVSYSYPSVTGGTCYSGYGGIYPQATPLQQVALALRKAPPSTTSGQASTACTTNSLASTAFAVSIPPKITSNPIAEIAKRPPQKRKFQELPVASKDTAKHHQNLSQGSECFKPGSKDSDLRNVSTMPPPKKLVEIESDGMPPPPPQSMPPPPPRSMPPPPRFDASKSSLSPPRRLVLPVSAPQVERSQNLVMKKTSEEAIPDTLLKLVEYGEEDDDIDVSGEEYSQSNLARKPPSKPFWAV